MLSDQAHLPDTFNAQVAASIFEQQLDSSGLVIWQYVDVQTFEGQCPSGYQVNRMVCVSHASGKVRDTLYISADVFPSYYSALLPAAKHQVIQRALTLLTIGFFIVEEGFPRGQATDSVSFLAQDCLTRRDPNLTHSPQVRLDETTWDCIVAAITDDVWSGDLLAVQAEIMKTDLDFTDDLNPEIEIGSSDWYVYLYSKLATTSTEQLTPDLIGHYGRFYPTIPPICASPNSLGGLGDSAQPKLRPTSAATLVRPTHCGRTAEISSHPCRS